jgi:hypothetical protein
MKTTINENDFWCYVTVNGYEKKATVLMGLEEVNILLHNT